MIELIRQKKVEDALVFAQEELAPRGEEHPEFLAELERTMTLLAYDVDAASVSNTEDAAKAMTGRKDTEIGEKTGIPAFITSLLHPAHRQSTAAQVNAAILTSQSHGPAPKLPNLLRMLAWGESLLGERADFPTLDLQIQKANTATASTGDAEMVI